MITSICAHIPTYNCPNLFLNCVNSILWVDEIIVADNSSDSRIFEVVKNVNHANIHYYKSSEPDIRKRLLNSVNHINSEFILWVHTDEIYSEQSASEIKSVLARNNSEIDGYIVPSTSYLYGEYFGKGHDQLRLFRKDKFYFDFDSIHDMPKVSGKTEMLNFGYIHSNSPRLSNQVFKAFLYADLDAKSLDYHVLETKRLDKVSSFHLKLKFLKFLIRMLWRGRYLFMKRKVSFIDLYLRYWDIMTSVANESMATERARIIDGKIPESIDGQI